MENVNKKPKNRSAYEKQLREVHRHLNLCTQCGKRDAYVMAGRAMCAECAEKERIWSAARREKNPERQLFYNKKSYQKAKEKGLCVRCRKPLPPGRNAVTCQRCNQLISQRRKEKLARDPNYISKSEFIETHPDICTRCLKQPRYKGYKLCEHCYEQSLVSGKKGTQKTKEAKIWTTIHF